FQRRATCQALRAGGVFVAIRQPRTTLTVPLRVRRLDVRRHGKVERHGSIRECSNLMPLAGARNADLRRTNNRRFASDRELGSASEDDKHFMTEVVGVAMADVARLEAHDARSDLRGDEEIADVRPRVENLKCHAPYPPVCFS